AGVRQAARDVLAQLQQMLENMRLGRMAAREGPAQRTMNQLQRMMQHQQRLLDKSFRDARNGATNERQSAQSQESLEQMLGELMRRLGATGGTPQALQRASRAMGKAAGALHHGRPGAAINPQTEALDQLQQGARGLAQRLYDRNGQAMAQGQGLAPGNRDPFGRMRSGQTGDGWVNDGGPVRFGSGRDSDTALRRAKAILDELRHRAGDRSRPKIEREYIDRLLREF
ncbi:MAG: DUF4175 family protein, partial [Stellaceae bacterium]